MSLPKAGAHPLVCTGTLLTRLSVDVDVIVPVHNAANTIREAVASAMSQVWIDRRQEAPLDASQQQQHIGAMPTIMIHVCCYNDASTDDSWSILQSLDQLYNNSSKACRPISAIPMDCDSVDTDSTRFHAIPIPSRLCISSSPPGSAARGAGYARNRAVALRSDSPGAVVSLHRPDNLSASTNENTDGTRHRFLCWLDSDDVMYPTRVFHQVTALLALDDDTRRRTLLGTHFDRIPQDATPHYTAWANALSAERLALERFREITLIQPTWMMCRERFELDLGGYLEAPPPHPLPSLQSTGASNLTTGSESIGTCTDETAESVPFSVDDWVRQCRPLGASSSVKPRWRLVHNTYDTFTTLRVAEDLRLFHEHLVQSGRLQRVRVTNNRNPHQPLISYRHSLSSQCGQTPRKLLLSLRVAALEKAVLSSHCESELGWGDETKFIVWGAGRDGKDFVKALSPLRQRRVYCMVDVDDQKIQQGFYVLDRRPHEPGGIKIPIVHFSLIAQDASIRNELYRAWKYGGTAKISEDCVTSFGRIDKSYHSTGSSNVFKDPREPPGSGLQGPELPSAKRTKTSVQMEKKDPGADLLDVSVLPSLPVIVCVAMYRTNRALERNVQLVGRTEGKDLWHFC
jgi:glycosyltransferase involved in cell wall biosynthesis